MKILKKEWAPALYVYFCKEIEQIYIRIDKRHDFTEVNLDIAEAEVLLKALVECIAEAKSKISEE